MFVVILFHLLCRCVLEMPFTSLRSVITLIWNTVFPVGLFTFCFRAMQGMKTTYLQLFVCLQHHVSTSKTCISNVYFDSYALQIIVFQVVT
jgi:hypothetical protein